MNDTTIAVLVFFISVFAAFVLGALMAGNTPTYKLGQEATQIIEQCEATLTRQEFCELTAKLKDK